MRSIFISLIIAASFMLGSCQKEVNGALSQDTVLGKWKVTKIEEVNVVGGVPQTTTYTGLPTDYVDYREDGKVYYNTFGFLDTLTWSQLNTQSLLQEGTDTFQIQTLTSTQFIETHHVSGSGYTYTEYLYK